MNCAICGKDNQAGTRFCVHCGAALAIPPATSQQSTIATAGAILGPKPAATNAGVTSAAPTPTLPAYSQRAAPASPSVDAAPVPPNRDSPPTPAYIASPKKAGLVVILIGVVGLVAAGGYLAYKIFGRTGEARDTITRIETPSAVPPRATLAPAPAVDTPPKAPEEKASPKSTEVSGAKVATTEPPVTVIPLPPKGEPKPRAAPAQPATRAPPVPSTATPATPPPPIVAQPAAPPASVTASTPVDRWARFAEELHRCTSESFLSRVVCDQRVRLRYCDGYWGKVPQCPGGVANPDRGQ